MSMFFLLLLFSTNDGLKVKNDLQIFKDAVFNALNAELPRNLPDTLDILELGNNQWAWVVKDQLESVLLSKGISVSKNSNSILSFRLEETKLSYRLYRKGFVGKTFVERKLYVTLNLKLKKDSNLLWVKELSCSYIDTIPQKFVDDVRYEGLSPPMPVSTDALSRIEELITIIAIGYIIFYVYSGKI